MMQLRRRDPPGSRGTFRSLALKTLFALLALPFDSSAQAEVTLLSHQQANQAALLLAAGTKVREFCGDCFRVTYEPWTVARSRLDQNEIGYWIEVNGAQVDLTHLFVERPPKGEWHAVSDLLELPTPGLRTLDPALLPDSALEELRGVWVPTAPPGPSILRAFRLGGSGTGMVLPPITERSDVDVAFYRPEAVSLTTYVYAYTGGAHGQNGFGAETYGFRDGQPLKLDLRECVLQGIQPQAKLVELARRAVAEAPDQLKERFDRLLLQPDGIWQSFLLRNDGDIELVVGNGPQVAPWTFVTLSRRDLAPLLDPKGPLGFWVLPAKTRQK